MTKKMVPEVRFEGFSDEWKSDLIGNHYLFKNGLNKNKEFFGIGSPIINYTDVFYNRALFAKNIKGKVLVSRQEIYNNSVQLGDILFTRTSETIEEIGLPSVVMDEQKDTVFSGFLLRARAIVIDPLTNEFKSYAFFTDTFRDEMTNKSTMSTRALTSGTSISKMFFNFPSNRREQTKIGKLFIELDQGINSKKYEIEKLKNFKQAMLKKMFPKEGEIIPEVRFKRFSGEWKTVKLGNVLNYEQPTKYIVESDKYINERKIPVLTAGKSLLLGYTDETEGIYKAREKNGVIIFDDFTTSSHLIEFDFKVKSSALKLLTTKSSDYNLYFIDNLIKNINYIPGNHERHWISIFSKFDVLVPTKEEQLQIGNFFKSMDLKIKLEEQKLQKLKQLKKSMLQKMFV